MARHRKIDVSLWDDPRFRRLSPIPPCGQGLWLFLLTNPDTSNIPGCYRATEAGLAETLGWSIKGFRKAFQEAVREGLAKASWPNRFIWIPSAIQYDPPQSPNVVRSWRQTWSELPDCALKVEVWHALKAFLEGFAEAFRQAFRESCHQPSTNLDLEPGPEPELEPTHKAPTAGDIAFDQFWSAYPRKAAKANARKAWARIRPDAPLRAHIMAALELHKKCPQWQKDNGQYIPHASTWLNQRRWEDDPLAMERLGRQADEAAKAAWRKRLLEGDA